MIDQKTIFKKYLIDTNIIIYTLKGINTAVETMEELENGESEIYYSTIVEAELFSFHQLTKEQKEKIRGVLDLGEIVNVDSEVALKAAEFRALSNKRYHRKLKLPDAIIAATAVICSSVLVTRNVDDFDHLSEYGLRIWNPIDK
jgi:predicted nucleic acid-binding protein